MSNNLLNEYAKLVVLNGVNVQKNQCVVISSPVDAAPLTRLIVTESYKAGASQVFVDWTDGAVTRDFYLHSTDEFLKTVHKWAIEKVDYYLDQGACFIHVTCPLVGINKDVDPKKMETYQRTMEPFMRRRREYTMSNHGQWCVVAYPNEIWAKKVFPKLTSEEAFKKLMENILNVSRVDENSISNWDKHNKNLKTRSSILNNYNFKALYFKNSLGTDLEVGLATDHVWCGGSDETTKGVVFNPNIPTEEIFSMPHKHNVNGKVVATMPLDYNGKLIEGFSFIFKDGKIVGFDALKEKDALETILNYDEGAKHIGEVALVPYDSPISKSGILFYNTLLDENASCHLALGKAYPTCMKNGANLSVEELAKNGYNHSMVHIDFMFGSKDMEIYGVTQDGKKVKVFEFGNFVI